MKKDKKKPFKLSKKQIVWSNYKKKLVSLNNT